VLIAALRQRRSGDLLVMSEDPTLGVSFEIWCRVTRKNLMETSVAGSSTGSQHEIDEHPACLIGLMTILRWPGSVWWRSSHIYW
jgi:hypothetical protein